MAKPHPKFIVGIGGSAGSLVAFKALVGALSPDTGMAFVIVSHVFPSAASELANILSRCTKMPVSVAATAMPIQPNHVYVSPPNADLFIKGYAFEVVTPRTPGNGDIDLFLTSLAEAVGARGVAIIMSGRLSDGTQGCKYLKAKGGITFAQDKTAEVDAMSRNAQAQGCIDYVMSPERMAAKLKKLAKTV